MFTGIVAAVGSVARVTPQSGGVRLAVDSGTLALDDVATGDSIAVNGVCLTAITAAGSAFEADVSQETLACTADFTAGARVNLEKALRLSDRLGGHLLSGHVDGVGTVTRFEPIGEDRLLAVEVPARLARYVAHKGSIAVNGVSLTVNAVDGAVFTANLIPHTLQSTTLRALQVGDRVNIEVDLLARYVERLRQFDMNK